MLHPGLAWDGLVLHGLTGMTQLLDRGFSSGTCADNIAIRECERVGVLLSWGIAVNALQGRFEKISNRTN